MRPISQPSTPYAGEPEIKGDVKKLASDVAEIKGKLSMLPGYGGIALIVGLFVGLSTVAQIAARFFQ